MTLLRNLSIKHKLTLLAMASSTLALLLVSAGFIVYESNTFQKEMTDDLSSTARIIGNHSRAYLLFGGTEKEVREIWSALGAKPHIAAACLYRGTNIAALPYFRDKNAPQLVAPHPGPFRDRQRSLSPRRLSALTRVDRLLRRPEKRRVVEQQQVRVEDPRLALTGLPSDLRPRRDHVAARGLASRLQPPPLRKGV